MHPAHHQRRLFAINQQLACIFLHRGANHRHPQTRRGIKVKLSDKIYSRINDTPQSIISAGNNGGRKRSARRCWHRRRQRRRPRGSNEANVSASLLEVVRDAKNVVENETSYC